MEILDYRCTKTELLLSVLMLGTPFWKHARIFTPQQRVVQYSHSLQDLSTLLAATRTSFIVNTISIMHNQKRQANVCSGKLFYLSTGEALSGIRIIGEANR